VHMGSQRAVKRRENDLESPKRLAHMPKAMMGNPRLLSRGVLASLEGGWTRFLTSPPMDPCSRTEHGAGGADTGPASGVATLGAHAGLPSSPLRRGSRPCCTHFTKSGCEPNLCDNVGFFGEARLIK